MNQSGTRTLQYAVRIEGSHISRDYADAHSSGEAALISGIYMAEHPAANDQHATEIVIVKGNEFPNCSRCGEPLEFSLLQGVAHISEDEDFQMKDELQHNATEK